MTLNTIPLFRPLTGIYEPSAIQQLADGRFLVVEDEKQRPFSLLTMCPDGSVGSTQLSAGPLASEQIPFQLWFWNGLPGESPRRVTGPALHSFEHAEGVGPAVIDGRQQIIIVSDDGSMKEGRFAHFLLLDHGQPQVGP